MLGSEFIVGRAMIGTFHQRRGDQYLQTGPGIANGAWGRFFGQSTDRRWNGTVAPELDANIFGLQAGLDLFSYEAFSGRGSLGVFVAHGRTDGDVRGFADAVQRNRVGRLSLENTGVGATWTHVDPSGGYLDALVMGQWLSGTATSLRGFGIKADGTGIAASIEGGYPLVIQPGLVIEPQGQFIWQSLDHDASRDTFSRLDFGSPSLATGRLGLRMQGTAVWENIEWRPYLLTNLWHNFSETSRIRFEAVPISTKLGGTSIEVGGGVVARVNANIGFFAQASYATGIGGGDENTVQGEIGLRVTW